MAIYKFNPQNRSEGVSRTIYLDALFAKAIKTANSSRNTSTIKGNFYQNEIDRVCSLFGLSPKVVKKTMKKNQYYCLFKI